MKQLHNHITLKCPKRFKLLMDNEQFLVYPNKQIRKREIAIPHEIIATINYDFNARKSNKGNQTFEKIITFQS